jgi:hypothetical protein
MTTTLLLAVVVHMVLGSYRGRLNTAFRGLAKAPQTQESVEHGDRRTSLYKCYRISTCTYARDVASFYVFAAALWAYQLIIHRRPEADSAG